MERAADGIRRAAESARIRIQHRLFRSRLPLLATCHVSGLVVGPIGIFIDFKLLGSHILTHVHRNCPSNYGALRALVALYEIVFLFIQLWLVGALRPLLHYTSKYLL